MKQCTKCSEIKLLDEFPKHPSTKDKRQSYCKSCRKIWNQSDKGKLSYSKYSKSKIAFGLQLSKKHGTHMNENTQ